MRGQPVAVISAGASGIGLTCARALAAEDYRVLTLDMDEDAVEAFRAEFGAGTAWRCDVSDAGQVEAAWGEGLGCTWDMIVFRRETLRKCCVTYHQVPQHLGATSQERST